MLARSALKSLGKVDGNAAQLLIEALLSVVGETGTVLGLSHSAISTRLARWNVFHRNAPCTTGGLASALLSWPGALRSKHPTNSMVAIGRDAEVLLRGHDETATCFGPIRKLIDANGKMMLVGCVESSPGFSTVHYAYEELGLAEKSIQRGLRGAYYERDGRTYWFAREDVPGCSMGFSNFYPLYRERGVLVCGKVGDADSMLVRAQDAYPIELSEIRRDPRISLCQNPGCFSCRGTKLFNTQDMFRFYRTHPLKLPHLAHAAAHRLLSSGRDSRGR